MKIDIAKVIFKNFLIQKNGFKSYLSNLKSYSIKFNIQIFFEFEYWSQNVKYSKKIACSGD